MMSVVRRLARVSLDRQASYQSKAHARASPGKQVDTRWAAPRRLQLATTVPRPPQKYTTVFAMFYKENAMKQLPARLVMRRLASVWANLSEEDKQMYRDAYAEKIETYDERYRDFQRKLTIQDQSLLMWFKLCLERHKLTRSYTDLQKIAGRPKAGTAGSFMLFVADHYRHEDGSKLTDDEYEKKLGHVSIARDRSGPEKLVLRSREIAAKWKSLRPEEKKPYIERYQQLNAERDKVYREWKLHTPRTYFEKLDLLRELRRMAMKKVIEPEKLGLMKACFEQLEEQQSDKEQ